MAIGKVAKLVFRLHEKQRANLQPSIDFRRNYLKATFAQQRRSEREHIQSNIDKLQPGTRKVFLASRLQHLGS